MEAKIRVFSSFAILMVTLVAGSGSAHAGSELPVFEDHFLGQHPPDSTAEIFAPGIVNTKANREIEGMASPDMQAFYVIRRPVGDPPSSNTLISIEYLDNEWRETVVAKGLSEPTFAPDGKTIYFKDQYIELTDTGWSELKSLGTHFDGIDIMRFSVSSNSTAYFDTYTDELDVPLRSSRLIDGKYEQPVVLGPQFAVGTYNAHPFIAPDESFVIWDSRRDGGYGSSDLYISYRIADGSWGPAINLGDKINTPDGENYPSVSSDGRFLFFDRRRWTGDTVEVDIYWVDAGFIEDLRPR